MGNQVSVEGVHVVVVGGGFGGIAAANQLRSHDVAFTLVDMRDGFHHNVAALRAAVKHGLAHRTFIPYAETFGDHFVQGRVQSVDTDRQTVTLEGGQEIHYTHLILCTGTGGPFPGKFNTLASCQTAVQRYELLVTEVEAAGSVLVVGGGSTGVEMAAEVKTEFPDKKVVLIHAHVDLADPGLLPSVRCQAKQVLLEKGVELLLGQKLVGLQDVVTNVCRGSQKLTTDEGEELTTDLVLLCTGQRVNSSAYASSLPCTCLAEDGSLHVNAHLQVHGFTNVYAVGDCANVREPKMAYHAGLHAAVAVGNIMSSLAGKALGSYHTGNVSMLLAMGHDDGVGQYGGVCLPRWLVTRGKSRDLLLWKSWREMKQICPPETP